jgi:hypothetical protein
MSRYLPILLILMLGLGSCASPDASGNDNNELEGQIAEKNREIDRLKKELAARDPDNPALGEEANGEPQTNAELETELAQREEELASLKAVLTSLVEPFQGFWQTRLPEIPDCSVFVQVDNLRFEKAVICPKTFASEGAETPEVAHYEFAEINDFMKVMSSDESADNFDYSFHRQLQAKTLKSSCRDVNNAAYEKTDFLRWTKVDGAEFIQAQTQGKLIDLGRGPVSAATCREILDNPDRPELGAAVFACKVFADKRVMENPSVGCYTPAGDAGLNWFK